MQAHHTSTAGHGSVVRPGVSSLNPLSPAQRENEPNPLKSEKVRLAFKYAPARGTRDTRQPIFSQSLSPLASASFSSRSSDPAPRPPPPPAAGTPPLLPLLAADCACRTRGACA